MSSGVSTSRGCPPATTRPSRSTSTLSQNIAARLRSCSATTVVTGRSRTRASSSSWWRMSRWLVGSSSSSSRGSCARARAMCARCRSPPESVRQARSAFASRPTCAMARSMAAASSAVSPPSSVRYGVRPRRTTSRTAMSTSVSPCCVTVATRRATSRRRIPARSAPSSVTRPESGDAAPWSSLRSDDLPDPFGPSSPTVDPGAGSSVTSSTTIRPPRDQLTPRASSVMRAPDRASAAA